MTKQNGVTNSSPAGIERAWLLATNFCIMYGWAKVLRLLVRSSGFLPINSPSSFPSTINPVYCTEVVVPAVYMALFISFLELLNSIIGATKSKPYQVLIFSIVRFGVEHLITPMLPSCHTWTHLVTIFVWSLGDTIRLGCFVLDLMVPGGHWAKSVRYTVGPLLFPIKEPWVKCAWLFRQLITINDQPYTLQPRSGLWAFIHS
jgi:hypothetical protein